MSVRLHLAHISHALFFWLAVGVERDAPIAKATGPIEAN